MCCRYSISESVTAWLGKFVPDDVKTGDVHPGDCAPALIAGGTNPAIAQLKWGIARKDRQLVINARSETLWERPMFRECIVKRRCVLPADCFYEWDNKKRKNTFWPSAGGVLLLAGLYSENGSYVVTTTEADSIMQMQPVHDRMPVCLPENVLYEWLFDAERARDIVKTERTQLRIEKPVEQLSLFG